jgi:hypothetical protein
VSGTGGLNAPRGATPHRVRSWDQIRRTTPTPQGTRANVRSITITTRVPMGSSSSRSTASAEPAGVRTDAKSAKSSARTGAAGGRTSRGGDVQGWPHARVRAILKCSTARDASTLAMLSGRGADL